MHVVVLAHLRRWPIQKVFLLNLDYNPYIFSLSLHIINKAGLVMYGTIIVLYSGREALYAFCVTMCTLR